MSKRPEGRNSYTVQHPAKTRPEPTKGPGKQMDCAARERREKQRFGGNCKAQVMVLGNVWVKGQILIILVNHFEHFNLTTI